MQLDVFADLKDTKQDLTKNTNTLHIIYEQKWSQLTKSMLEH